ncbi:ADP-ribosyl cyclase/cyclic ADP-ribose hydrolase [Citrus sinensis]|nr:ADP-ribosyl cyclase/cyclic ADP-ribose hydrolase [Citrus sinensis]
MPKLRFLKFYSSSVNGENKCKISYLQDPGFAEVKYLHWSGYPLKSLPSNLSAKKLVLLEVPDSDIERLWDCVKHYSKLNQIIHAACNMLTAKIPNPTLMPRMKKLVILNLRGSKSLKSLPSGIFNLEFLTELDLSGCSKLKRLPEISSGNIKWLFLRGTAIEELPSSIERLLWLGYVDLSDYKRLKSVPSSLCKLKPLGVLNLCGCSNLQRLPECLGQLSYPIILNLAKTNIERIPESIMQLFVLRYLLLGYSERFQSLPKPSFLARGCQTLQRFLGIVEDALRIQNTLVIRWQEIQEKRGFYLGKVHIVLPGNEIPKWFKFQSVGSFITLEMPPDFFNNNRVQGIAFSAILAFSDRHRILMVFGNAIAFLRCLENSAYGSCGPGSWPLERSTGKERFYQGHFVLAGNEIPRWFHFQSVGSFITLEMPPDFFNNNRVLGFAFGAILAFSDRHVDCGRWFSFSCELKVKTTKDGDPHDIQLFESRVHYILRIQWKIQTHVSSITKKKSLPAGIFNLEFLTTLDLSGCSKLKRLPEISSSNTSCLFFSGTAIEELPSSIELLIRLGYLDLSDCKRLKSLPSSLCKLKSLEILDLSGCSNLQRLSECLGQLSSLGTLLLEKTNIERIPESIIQISVLTYLRLSYCEKLQSVPKLPFLVRWLDADQCTSLQSLSGIVEDALQRIQLMAAAHWKEVQENIDFHMNGGHILLLGNEIPKWFEFQSVGSFITLEMPPDFFNNNRVLLGFAFSAILAFSDRHVDYGRWFSFSFELKVKTTKDCGTHDTRLFQRRVNYVESDHLHLGHYLFCEEDFNGF